jgi:hypothetical protein
LARPSNASQLSFCLGHQQRDSFLKLSDTVFMLEGQVGDPILVGKWQRPS